MTILTVYWVFYLLLTLVLIWGAYAENQWMLAPWLLGEVLRIVMSQLLGLTAILKVDNWADMLQNATWSLPENSTLLAASDNLYLHINVPGILALLGVLVSFYFILIVYSFFEELRAKANAVVPIPKAPAKPDA
ncbi:unnamed protein product [Notodromas monacha]|uniref:Uncharacterized protein n=1 Tax=Notodromas monacha TaxID=399045 RepID=A0A7R9BWZ8_9CRUS|nr:unnamed protein product [Notodromas monacha]CAG0922151.1 unnamed protein product [Notodromas monacha]